MFKHFLIFSVLSLLTTLSYSQNIDRGTIPEVGMGGSWAPNDNIQSVVVPSVSKVSMEHFLVSDWSWGEIVLDGGSRIKTLPFKIDLLNSYVLLKAKDGSEKGLPFARLDSAFVVQSDGAKRIFITKVTGFDGMTSRDGFFEIVPNLNNDHSLVTQYDVEIVQPNYKMALDTGHKEPTSRLQTENFIIYNSKLYPVLRSKKKFVRQFSPEDEASLLKQLKSLKTNLKDRSSLLLFIESLE